MFVSYNDSTEEQRIHGMSIDTQITALQDYCKEHGYEVYDIYNDAGFSARKSYKKRPGLLRMIEDCENFNIILFTRLDRFTRSVKDYYSILAKLNKPWRAIWEDYETETPDGTFKVNIMLSVAQAEADKTSARIKDSYQYRKAKGIYVGQPPIGYKVSDKRLVKDSQTMDGIDALFRTYLQTYSASKAIHAADKYGIKLELTNVHKILKNPTYSGKTKNGHLCEGYITPEEHDRILAVKGSRTPLTKHSDRVYLFSGLIVCGYCGRRMHGKTRVQGKRGRYYTYVRYACDADLGTVRHHPHLEISETKMEQFLLENLSSILDDLTYEAKIKDKGTSDTLKEKKRLEGKLERLKDIYIDGDLPRDEYLARKVEIEKQISALPKENRPLPELPKDWRGIYDSLTKQNKQSFFKTILKKIVLTNENKGNPDIFFY